MDNTLTTMVNPAMTAITNSSKALVSRLMASTTYVLVHAYTLTHAALAKILNLDLGKNLVHDKAKRVVVLQSYARNLHHIKVICANIHWRALHFEHA